MKRFKSKKGRGKKLKIMVFLIVFGLGFYYSFTYFVDPSVLLSNIKERFFRMF